MASYSVTLDVNEKKFKASGKSALEAIESLTKSVPTMMFKTKATLVLKKGKKESQQIFFALQFRRLQGGKVAREIWAKRLDLRMS